jgi:hypothetical protein
MRKIKNAIGITLLQNHRDPIVDDLIKIYEEAEARGLKLGSSGASGRSKK